MFRFGLMFLSIALAAGCTTREAVNEDIQWRYVGLHADAFFLERGAPVASKKFQDGGRIYLWFSGRDSAHVPGDEGTVSLIGNTAWWRGYTLENYNPLLECRVEIITDPHGFITGIQTHAGNRDWWDVQRCREVFGPPAY